MHQSENLLAQYGVDSYTRVKRAIADLRAGRGVMVVDDENRENEGDLILSTDFLTVEQMAQGTAFCVSIEAAHGCTTGVSAKDRVTTIKAAANPNGKPEDLLRPGHVYPLRARPNGVLERRGHTEATVDLMRIAGLNPAGVLCELMNPDGTMAKLPQVCEFANMHGLCVITVEDLVRYRQAFNC